GEAIPHDAPAFDLFPQRGTEDETVADYADLSVLRTPVAAGGSVAPSRRPYAAFDGRLDTAWAPPDPLAPCPCLELTLRHRRAVPYIRVHPSSVSAGAPVALGVSVNGGHERVVSLSALGWNRV